MKENKSFSPPKSLGNTIIRDRLIQTCNVLDKPNLTSRQLAILLDLRDGYSYEDISKHIGIMKNSAKTQINRMYKALGVKSAKDAVEKAEAFGLLDL